MKKEQFLAELERLLFDISEEERQEALAYYRDYLEDAGEENLEEVLKELESPQKVAGCIRDGIYSGMGYDTESLKYPPLKREPEEKKENTGRWTGNYGSYQSTAVAGRNNKTSKWILVLIVIIFTCPLWLSVGGVLIGAVAAIIGLLVALIGTVASGICAGVVAVLVGLVKAVTVSAASGLVLMGTGFLSIAVSLLGLMLLVCCFARLLPWMLKQLGRFFHWMLQKVKGVTNHEKIQ